MIFQVKKWISINKVCVKQVKQGEFYNLLSFLWYVFLSLLISENFQKIEKDTVCLCTAYVRNVDNFVLNALDLMNCG